MLRAFFADSVRGGRAAPGFPDRGYFRLATPVFRTDGKMVAAVGAYVELTTSLRVRMRLRNLAVRAAAEITEALA